MTDIATLFARDPLGLTNSDIDLIISEMRKSRAQFNMGNLKAGSTKPKTEKQKKLDDLIQGLDISI